MNATPQTLTSEERETLSAIADVLIPRSARMPSASDVGLCGLPIDLALGIRPDLLVTARALAKQARGRHAQDIVREIEVDDPKTLNAALQLIAGAYFMLPEVRGILGYAGQKRR